MKSTRKVLVDTSTLFSALGWTGAPFKVLSKIHEDDFKLVLTDYVLDELSNHLEDYPIERREDAFQSMEYLRETAFIIRCEWEGNLEQAEKLVGEKKDAPIMAAFLLEEVDILVTSDLKDFPIDEYDNILTPNDFLEIF